MKCFLSNYAPKWEQIYAMEHYSKVDPTVHHCATQNSVLFHRELEERYLAGRMSPLEIKHHLASKDFLSGNGICFPLNHEGSAFLCGASLIGDLDTSAQKFERDMALLMPELTQLLRDFQDSLVTDFEVGVDALIIGGQTLSDRAANDLPAGFQHSHNSDGNLVVSFQGTADSYVHTLALEGITADMFFGG